MDTIKEFGKDYKERIENAIHAFQEGRGVLLVDDEDRENEGDIIYPSKTMNEKDMALMIRECSGIVCLCITEEKSKALQLNPMVVDNTSLNQTAFTTTIEAKEGVTTGVSAKDRITTIRTAVAENAVPSDLSRPGHVFPLIAKPGGVFERRGHTEGSIDLAKLAGLGDSAVLCELTNEDGTMSRLPEVIAFGHKHKMPVITIEDIKKYRESKLIKIEQGITAKLPTKYGDFKAIPFEECENGKEHIALIKGTWEENEDVLVRVHSSCMTGDIFGSYRCDCGDQLQNSMKMIDQAGKGVIVYLDQEGRGIGLLKKMHAYKLQEEGMDTIEANIKVGCKADERDYEIGALILKSVGVKSVKLLTNNPDKSDSLTEYGIKVASIESMEIKPNDINKYYLSTKKHKMGHLLSLVE